MNENWNKVITETNLISLPDVYWKLKDILNSRDYSMQDVTKLISLDPGLTARLLRIVNSAYFGFAAKIGSINQAVSILGIRQIEDLVLTTAIADGLGGYECGHLDIRKFWLGSVYRAIAARNLASECNLMDGERMFVAGLLSDIGHLIMYKSIPAPTQNAQDESLESQIELHAIETRLLGFNHTDVAAHLMREWSLPESLITLIDKHLDFDAEADFILELGVLQLASKMSSAYVNKIPLEEKLTTTKRLIWNITSLDIERCQLIDKAVDDQLDSVTGMIFPNLQRSVG